GAEKMAKKTFHCALPALVLSLQILTPPSARAQQLFTLEEQFPVGYVYHVSCRSELSGSLNLPGDKGQPSGQSLTMSGSGIIEYHERVLAHGAGGQVSKTVRLFHKVDLHRKVGDRLQENTVRPSVRRLVLLRHQQSEVPFSPDGPLTWNEIDLVRTDV